MSYEAFDTRIKEAQHVLQVVRGEAESLVSTFAPIVSLYASEVSKHIIDRAIKERPEVIQNMSDDDLAKLKTSFNDVLAQLPSASEAGVQAIAWPHRADLTDSELADFGLSFEVKQKVRDACGEAARCLLGRVGELLVKYHLTDTQSHSEWQVGPDGRQKYRYGLPDVGIAHADEFKKIPEQYGAMVDKYIDVTRSLVEAKRAKAQAQAKDRWDQV